MTFRKKIPVLIVTAALCTFSLTGCGERISLGDDSFFLNSRRISAVITADEAEKLDEFPKLKRLDLSGSTCYEEITEFREAHPDIKVLYTVELPDGSIAESTVTSLTLSEETVKEPEKAAEAIQYLPDLKEIELSFDNDTNLKLMYSVSSLRPDISYKCDVSVNGEPVSRSETSLDMTGMSKKGAEQLLHVLPAMPELKKVYLGSDEGTPALSFDMIYKYQTARPDVEFIYDFEFCGMEFSLNDEKMDLNHIPMSDEGESVRNVIRCMPKLRFLDMDSCGVSNEAMASIRDDFPDVKVVWRVWFGNNYSVRTDVEKILASKPSLGGNLNGYNCEALKYCTDVKFLDLGHNEIMPDISFTAYMPKLEVAILAMSIYSDITPLQNCTELEYLEIQTTNISDLTPLSGLKKLKHLNIANQPYLTDISPLYELPQLERLWIGCIDPVPYEQVEKMQSIAPDCVINTTTYDPTEGGWRYTGEGGSGLAPRYEKLIEQFEYPKGNAAYSFFWNDPLY